MPGGEQKLIHDIQMGMTVDGKVAWVFRYTNGVQESFAFHVGIAKQFIAGLQKTVRQLETHASLSEAEIEYQIQCFQRMLELKRRLPSPSQAQDGLAMTDIPSVRLTDVKESIFPDATMTPTEDLLLRATAYTRRNGTQEPHHDKQDEHPEGNSS